MINAIFEVECFETGAGVRWESIAPAAGSHGRVLIFPGLTSPYHQKYVEVYRDLGRQLAANGWEAAVFACRGQLGSAGVYSFVNAVEDALAVLAAWNGDSSPLPLGFFARSSGCPIALRAARLSSSVQRLLLWGGSPRGVYDRLFGSTSDGSYMRACVDHGSRMAADFIDTLFYPEDEISRCGAPIVWLGLGTGDDYTGPAEQTSILLSATARHSALHVIPRCPHGVSAASEAWPSFRDMLWAWLSVHAPA